MKLAVSNKVASVAKKPRIKKGYYPAILTKVEEFKKDSKLVDCKFGNQLIFTFTVYSQDEKGKPINPIKYCPDDKEKDTLANVELVRFVYHICKNNDGTTRTGVTKNSKITQILIALGWTFDASKEVDIDSFIGKWVELNVNDFEYKKEGQDTYAASTIDGIGKYEGPNIDEDKPTEKAKESSNETKKITDSEDKSFEEKKKAIGVLRDDKIITEEGYDQAIEQLEAQDKSS